MAARPEERSLPETLLIYFLQVLGAVTAIIFGVFGVLSWSDAKIAKQQAETAVQQANTANMLALVALCAQGSQAWSVSIITFVGEESKFMADRSIPRSQSSFSAFCAGVQAAAEAPVTSLASSLLGPITPSSTFTRSASSVSSSGSSATVTSTTTAIAVPSSTNYTTSSAPGPGALSLSSGAKPGLGLGIGIAGIVVFITIMTVWTVRSKRRSPCHEHDCFPRGVINKQKSI